MSEKKIAKLIERLELHIGVIYLGQARSSFSVKQGYEIVKDDSSFYVKAKDAKESLGIPYNQVKCFHIFE
jgi:hypothetical protein